MGADLFRRYVVPGCLPHGSQQYGRRARPSRSQSRQFAAGLHHGGPEARHREALGEYLKSFDPHIVALTGTEEQVAALVNEYRVQVQPRSGSDYIVNHSSFYYLINPERKFVRVIAADVSEEELADRL